MHLKQLQMPSFCRILLLTIFVFFNKTANGQLNRYVIRTIAFYNVENLFDPFDDPDTADEDYTPNGKNQYTRSDYLKKIKLTAKVLSEIGSDMNDQSPVLIGLAEVENYSVLNDLIHTQPLADGDYQIIHKDSPDHRGIDVALIYKPSFFSTNFERIYGGQDLERQRS